MKVTEQFGNKTWLPNKGRTMGDFGEMGFSFSDAIKGITKPLETAVKEQAQQILPEPIYVELSQNITDLKPDLKAAVQGQTGQLTDSIMGKVMSKLTGDKAQVAAAEKVGADVGAAYAAMKKGDIAGAFKNNKTGAIIIASVLGTFGIFGFIVIRGIVKG